MPTYEIDITLHHHGTVHIDAPNLDAARTLARQGRWEFFADDSVPKITVRAAKLAARGDQTSADALGDKDTSDVGESTG